MKATRNNDGMIDLTGIPEKTAYALMALVGNVSGGYETTHEIWSALKEFFPKYTIEQLWNKYPIFESYDNIFRLNQKNLDTSFNYATRVLPAKTTQSLPRRDASGRFEKKVWVARFEYPDSSSFSKYYPNYNKRTVITNLTGKRRPLFDINFDSSIEGVDLLRGSFRKFLTSKIRGDVKWTKEYQSDVR